MSPAGSIGDGMVLTLKPEAWSSAMRRASNGRQASSGDCRSNTVSALAGWARTRSAAIASTLSPSPQPVRCSQLAEHLSRERRVGALRVALEVVARGLADALVGRALPRVEPPPHRLRDERPLGRFLHVGVEPRA